MVVDNQLIQTSRKPSKESRHIESKSKLTLQDFSPHHRSKQELNNKTSSNQVSQFIPISTYRGSARITNDGIIVSSRQNSVSRHEKQKSTESIRRQKLRFIVEYAHKKQIENQKII